MELTKMGKRIVWIVGILAAILLAVLLLVYLKFGRKPKEEPIVIDQLVLQNIVLEPIDGMTSQKYPVLDADVMAGYDFTVLEVWYPESPECVNYISEMNMFAEECLHRDDEMYAYVTGVCIHMTDSSSGAVLAERVNAAKKVAENADYPQYVADSRTEKILAELTAENYPAVVFLNRQGEIMRVEYGKNGKELCDCLDELVDVTMKVKKQEEKRTKEAAEKQSGK